MRPACFLAGGLAAPARVNASNARRHRGQHDWLTRAGVHRRRLWSRRKADDLLAVARMCKRPRARWQVEPTTPTRLLCQCIAAIDPRVDVGALDHREIVHAVSDAKERAIAGSDERPDAIDFASPDRIRRIKLHRRDQSSVLLRRAINFPGRPKRFMAVRTTISGEALTIQT
jgi:hypothetical protein